MSGRATRPGCMPTAPRRASASVPAAAKNLSAAILRTFNGSGASPWTKVTSFVDGTEFLVMTFRIPAVAASQYVRAARHEHAARRAVRDRRQRQPAAPTSTRTRRTRPGCAFPARRRTARAASSTAARTTWRRRRRRRPARQPDRRPEGGRRSTSRPGRTCGSTATRSTSRSRARRRSPASSRYRRSVAEL